MNTYKIKKWAKENIILARLYFFFYHILLSSVALSIGVFYFDKLQSLPSFSFLIPLLMMIGLLVWDKVISKKTNIFAHISMTSLRFHLWVMLLIPLGKYATQPTTYSLLQGQLSLSIDKTIDVDKSFLLEKNESNLKKEVKKKFLKVKKFLTKPDYSKDWKVILFVLLGLATLFVLGYISFFAACSLSCNGQEALAIIVLLGGLTGLTFSEIYIVKKIISLFEQIKKDRPEDFTD